MMMNILSNLVSRPKIVDTLECLIEQNLKLKSTNIVYLIINNKYLTMNNDNILCLSEYKNDTPYQLNINNTNNNLNIIDNLKYNNFTVFDNKININKYLIIYSEKIFIKDIEIKYLHLTLYNYF